MTQSMQLSAAGFEELSGEELAQVNGGGWGWLATAAAWIGRAISWEVIGVAILLNTLYDPEGAWDDFWAGFDFGMDI